MPWAVLGSGGASSPNLPRAPGSSATCTRCVSGLDIPLSVPGIGSLPPRAVDRSSVTSRFSRDGRARYARSRDPPGATPAWLRVPAAPRAGSPGAEVASGVWPLGITRRSGTGSDVTRPTDCRGSRTEVGEAATVIQRMTIARSRAEGRRGWSFHPYESWSPLFLPVAREFSPRS